MNYSAIENLHFKEVFVGQGFDELLDAIHQVEDYTVALFESTTHRIIWVTDDAEAGHSIFVEDTNGQDKNKLLEVHNPEQKSLFLWHIDGVMFEQLAKCDCALLHDRMLHLVEFKANALNNSLDTIAQHYDKACNQLSMTFDKFKALYESHGYNIWDIFDGIDALAVFNKTVPQNDAFQKSRKKAFMERNGIKLGFGNEVIIKTHNNN